MILKIIIILIIKQIIQIEFLSFVFVIIPVFHHLMELLYVCVNFQDLDGFEPIWLPLFLYLNFSPIKFYINLIGANNAIILCLVDETQGLSTIFFTAYLSLISQINLHHLPSTPFLQQFHQVLNLQQHASNLISNILLFAYL